MHFALLSLPVALLAAVASGHTINCWGKALNPPVESVDYITDLMDKVATGESDTIPGYSDRKSLYLDGKSCKELACFKGAQVRWCNTAGGGKTLQMQNIVDAVKVLRRDCRAVVPPHDTAGGVLYQTDNWNVILQQEDACEGKE